jgi:hypothetical protein
MAAYTTGASWSFPDDLPGAFNSADHDSPKKPQPHHAFSQDQQDAPQFKEEPATPSPADDVPKPRRRRHYPSRTCRICLEAVEPTFHQDSSLPSAFNSEPRVTYESEEGGRMLRPCKCKGTQKYVHEDCLGAWRMADPLQKRNYYECPTCRYRYQLQRLTLSSWISSTSAQIGLTIAIFLVSMFALGFVADPLLNLYFDPVATVASGGGPSGSLIFEDEDVSWAEHFFKGFASMGLLGCAKYMLTLSPWHWFNGRSWIGRGSGGGNGRNRARELNSIAIAVGVATVVYAIWKGVRSWSRRTLEKAGERVMDVPGSKDDDDDDDE